MTDSIDIYVDSYPQKKINRKFFSALWRLLRPYQWIKNTLVWVPLLAAHQYGDISKLIVLAIAFCAFNLVSSSAYVMNDVLDVAHDRLHPRKKNRPFAARELPIIVGWILTPLLFCLAILLSDIFLSLRFAESLCIYFLLTVAYSVRLKKYIALDAVVLAVLYTMRIIAGGVAIAVDLSFWLLAFSLFLFLSLAWVKRYSELSLLGIQKDNPPALPGRGYISHDLHFIASVGAASGYLSVLVFALYIHDNAASYLYHAPQLLWLACPLLLYWVSYIWLVAYRGNMHDDPILFIIKDKLSLLVGILFVVIGVCATVL